MPQSEAEPRSLSWATPPGASSPGLRLKVALDAGGGQAYVNAAGELLMAGPVPVGSGESQRYHPALVRRDAAGTPLWSRAYAPDARLFGALADDGSTLAAGYFMGHLQLAGAELESFRNPTSNLGSASNRDDNFWRGAHSQDIVVLRLTAAGDVMWARRFGDAGDQVVRAIDRSAAGELLVVGDFQGQLAMDEHVITSSNGGSGADVFIARFAASGAVTSLWREAPLHVDALALAPDGSLWLAGRAAELTENQLWKLSPEGQRLLSLAVGGSNITSATKMAPGPAGSVYVLYNGAQGEPLFERPVAGDGALVRLSARGEVEWLEALSSELTISLLAADARGNVTVAGAFRENIDVGAGELASSGDLDVFVASYSVQGALRYSFRLGSPGADGINDIVALPTGGWLLPFYIERPITLLEQQVSGGEHLLWIDEL